MNAYSAQDSLLVRRGVVILVAVVALALVFIFVPRVSSWAYASPGIYAGIGAAVLSATLLDPPEDISASTAWPK